MQLAETWTAMKSNVMTAILIIFLLLVILLRNFIWPMIIILAIPVSVAGGIGGLAFLNLFVRQPPDMLTMLGFVILTGVVVNNAILMIEQTTLHVREEGLNANDAIMEAARNRIRPIFMSTPIVIVWFSPVGGLSRSGIRTLSRDRGCCFWRSGFVDPCHFDHRPAIVGHCAWQPFWSVNPYCKINVTRGYHRSVKLTVAVCRFYALPSSFQVRYVNVS